MSTSTPDRDQPRDANTARNAATFRLTIAHLLLWTAATAFVVSIFPQNWLRTSLPPFVIVPAAEHVARQRLFEKWSIVAVSPFYGVAVTSVVIAGSQLLQRRAGFPSQPGHWLLVQTGLGVLAASCFVASDYDLFSFSIAKLHAVRRSYGVIVLGLLAFLGAAGIASCRAIREPRRWRIVLRLQATVAIAPLVAFLVATTDPVPTSPPSLVRMVLGLWGIGILATVIAGAWDLVQRAKYDLIHYAGIVVPVVLLMHPVVTRWVAEWWP